jgi:hypothetical protein
MRQFKKEQNEKAANNQQSGDHEPRQRSVKLTDHQLSTSTEERVKRKAVKNKVTIDLGKSSAAISKFALHQIVKQARRDKRDSGPDSVSEGASDDSDRDRTYSPTRVEIQEAGEDEEDNEVATDSDDDNKKKKKKLKSRNPPETDSSYRPNKEFKSKKEKRLLKKRESNAAGAEVNLNQPIVPSPTRINRPSTVVISAYNDYYDDYRQQPRAINDNENHGEEYGEEYEDTAGDLMAFQDLTPDLQSGVRDLLDSTDPADNNLKILLSVVLQRTSAIQKQASEQADQIAQLKSQVKVLIGLKGRNKLFFILKGDSSLFHEMVNTIKRYIQFPLFHIKQLNFLEKLLGRFPFIFFVVVSHSAFLINYCPFSNCFDFFFAQVVFFQSASMGGDVYMSARGIWNKLFTDRLTRRLAWAGFGQLDDEGYAKVGAAKRRLFMFRQVCPNVRNLVYGKCGIRVAAIFEN